MSEFREQIEEARARVAQCRIRAERPSARLEEEYALEKARNRLLTLELKELQQEQRTRSLKREKTRGEPSSAQYNASKQSATPFKSRKRIKRKQIFISARQSAETKFAALQEGINLDKEGH